ncbi:MAG: ribonuclease P protein component [Oscillospiraceae bacterium]|nr:ribonuclease P protein component [Oscillospiraceae bacterium]
MRFSVSLKQNHIFRRLYTKGKSAVNRHLVLYCRRNGRAQNRLGYTISPKLCNAVLRNRTKRRLREIYRLHETQFLPGYDIVVVARSRAINAPFSELTQAYLSLAGKLGLLQQKEPLHEDDSV